MANGKRSPMGWFMLAFVIALIFSISANIDYEIGQVLTDFFLLSFASLVLALLLNLLIGMGAPQPNFEITGTYPLQRVEGNPFYVDINLETDGYYYYIIYFDKDGDGLPFRYSISPGRINIVEEDGASPRVTISQDTKDFLQMWHIHDKYLDRYTVVVPLGTVNTKVPFPTNSVP